MIADKQRSDNFWHEYRYLKKSWSRAINNKVTRTELSCKYQVLYGALRLVPLNTFMHATTNPSKLSNGHCKYGAEMSILLIQSLMKTIVSMYDTAVKDGSDLTDCYTAIQLKLVRHLPAYTVIFNNVSVPYVVEVFAEHLKSHIV